MYFCPCSCSKPDCENEEDVLICLPRNLSYAGESYLDRYSVSSAYVHNTKLEKQLLNADVADRYLKAGAAACAELRDIEVEEALLAAGGVVGVGPGGGRGRGEEGKGEEEEEEEEEDAGYSEHLLGACACAMATRPVTYSEESTPFFRTTGGPDHCCDGIVDTAPTSSIADLSLSASPLRTPDPEPEAEADDHPLSSTMSSSPPCNGGVNEVNDHDHDHPPPSPPKLTVTIAARGGEGGMDKGCSSTSNDTDINTSSSANARQQTLFDRYVVQQKPTESPDSDLVSEEGIFVNMMDDLDGLNGDALGVKSTVSEASDDTYVSGDSMYYSPEDVDDMDEDQVRGQDLKVSLEEAVQQAAAFVFRGAGEENREGGGEGEKFGGGGGGDEADDDKNVFVVSLIRPHADDGESQDCADGYSRGAPPTECEEKKDGDLNPPGYSAGPALQVDTGVNADTAASDANSKPQSPKSLGPLEISVADSKATPANLLNADGGPKLGSSYHDLLSPNSPLYDDNEFNFQRTKLRKSTSLKSSKTPPGTPRRKKVVRFADAMGLDLESVRHVLNLESPPKIPASAMKDLEPGLSEDRKGMGSKFITETFVQPGVDPHFRDRVMAGKVSLENALIVSGSITGVVRVANIGFHKAVRVRFTTNGWASFHDIAASYMINSNDGPTDRFSFTLVPPPDFCPGSRLEFAISYSVNGTDFWDNNYGQNYVFECYAKTVPTEAENAWMHFL